MAVAVNLNDKKALMRLPKILASPAKVIFVLALLFFAFQAFTGEQGLLSWRQYSIEAERLEQEKQILTTRKTNLQNSVNRLSSNSPDKDFIEDVALNNLNMANSKDMMIKLNVQPQPENDVK